MKVFIVKRHLIYINKEKRTIKQNKLENNKDLKPDTYIKNTQRFKTPFSLKVGRNSESNNLCYTIVISNVISKKLPIGYSDSLSNVYDLKSLFLDLFPRTE